MVVIKEKTSQPRFAKIFPAKYMVTNNSPNINPAKILCYTVEDDVNLDLYFSINRLM